MFGRASIEHGAGLNLLFPTNFKGEHLSLNNGSVRMVILSN